MEDLLKRVPLINQNILKYLDEKSIVNFKQTSREIIPVLEKEKFYWIRVLNQYKKSFKEFQDTWKMIISKTHAQNVKNLALAASQFFKEKNERLRKEWHPLFIAALQGPLKLCEFVIEKTGDINLERHFAFHCRVGTKTITYAPRIVKVMFR